MSTGRRMKKRSSFLPKVELVVEESNPPPSTSLSPPPLRIPNFTPSRVRKLRAMMKSMAFYSSPAIKVKKPKKIATKKPSIQEAPPTATTTTTPAAPPTVSQHKSVEPEKVVTKDGALVQQFDLLVLDMSRDVDIIESLRLQQKSVVVKTVFDALMKVMPPEVEQAWSREHTEKCTTLEKFRSWLKQKEDEGEFPNLSLPTAAAAMQTTTTTSIDKSIKEVERATFCILQQYRSGLNGLPVKYSTLWQGLLHSPGRVGNVLRLEASASRRLRGPHIERVLLMFLNNLPLLNASRWFAYLSNKKEHNNNNHVHSLLDFFMWLEEDSYRPLGNAMCGMCGKPSHRRGRCPFSFPPWFVLSSSHRLYLVMYTIICWTEEKRLDLDNIPEWKATEVLNDVSCAFREGEYMLTKVSDAMDQMHDLIRTSEHQYWDKYQLRIELEERFFTCLKFTSPLDVEKFRVQSKMIEEDKRKCSKEVKTLTERNQELIEVLALDKDIEAKTDLAASTKEAHKSALQALEVSAQRLKKAQEEKKRAELAKREQLKSQENIVTQELYEWQERLKTLRAQKKMLEDALKPKKKKNKATTTTTTTKTNTTTLFSCVLCAAAAESSVMGRLLPCSHGLCLPCFQEIQEMSTCMDVPFLYTNCPKQDCDKPFSSIFFPEFTFDPKSGKTTGLKS